jgi:hypothetical protein
MTRFSKNIIPLLLVFIATSTFCLVGKDFLQQYKINDQVLLWGNIILFIVTILSLWLLTKAMHAKTTANFLGFVYGSIMGKIMICAITVFVYSRVAKPMNKPAILILMGLYIVYTAIEVIKINALKVELKNAKATGSH